MSEELKRLHGFIPCDGPVTWGELKELIDDSALDLAMVGRAMVSIESITFGEQEIAGQMMRGILVETRGIGGPVDR